MQTLRIRRVLVKGGSLEMGWKMVDGGDDSLARSPLNGCLGGDGEEIGKQEDSPPVAPALSQGLGGDTDAIIGINLASGPVQGDGEDDGLGDLDLDWRRRVEVDQLMGGMGGEEREKSSCKSHVAGSGEAEDVGVCRPPGKLMKRNTRDWGRPRR
jgi:hypothetical protein